MFISDILKSNNVRLLFFLFFNINRELVNNDFEISIRYRKSTKTNTLLDHKIIETNNTLMSNYTSMNFDYNNSTHRARIINDLKLSREELLNEIYRTIQQTKFIYEEDDFEEALYMGLFAFRGSIDLNRFLYSVDLLEINISNSYIKNLTSLLMSSTGVKQLNLNFRELQPEYVKGKKTRNTQIRVNLRWYFDNYINTIKKINIYKAMILEDNVALIHEKDIARSYNNTFIERLLFYKNEIVNSKSNFMRLSEAQKKNEISKWRNELDFEDDKEIIDDKIRRNPQIVTFAKILLPDECVACKDKYNVYDRTFKQAKSGKPFLEIHHVISFGSDNNSDQLENLVKLCPACHRALTPNRAERDYQEKLIKNIIINSSQLNEYLNNFLMEKENVQHKIDFVMANLK